MEEKFIMDAKSHVGMHTMRRASCKLGRRARGDDQTTRSPICTRVGI
jgi:hypothetical protein